MDAMGAVNILNRRLNSGGIVHAAVVPCGEVKYLRPADLRRRRSRPGAGRSCLGGSAQVPDASSEARGHTPLRASA
ncbi:MAG: hypothetical protein C4337_00395 [Armatimonadota bacterium]